MGSGIGIAKYLIIVRQLYLVVPVIIVQGIHVSYDNIPCVRRIVVVTAGINGYFQCAVALAFPFIGSAALLPVAG